MPDDLQRYREQAARLFAASDSEADAVERVAIALRNAAGRHASWCGAPYPWAAGVSCVKSPHPAEEPHRLGKGVTVDVGPGPEWPGAL